MTLLSVVFEFVCYNMVDLLTHSHRPALLFVDLKRYLTVSGCLACPIFINYGERCESGHV